MRRIGDYVRSCSLIMYYEVKHLFPGFLLIGLILLASHLLGILLPQNDLLPYHIFYYRKFLLWRMDQTLGVLLCVYLLASQLWKSKQRHLLRYELLPIAKTELTLGKMLALASYLCIYCLFVDIFYLGGYKLMSGMHPELLEATGLFQAVGNAYYIQFFLPTTIEKGIWLLLLICLFSFLCVTLETAFHHPLLYLPYLIGFVCGIALLSFWYLYYHMPLPVYGQLEADSKLQEICFRCAAFLQTDYRGELLLVGWGLLAIVNDRIVPRVLEHRREKNL